MKRILTTGPGLLIAIPTLGRPVPIQWAWAFKSLNVPINFNTNFMQIAGKPVADARNECAQAAIKQGAKYLFFLGDDVEVPAHTLRQLIFRMENVPNCGVVGGVYCSKSDPPAPLVFTENGKGSYWDFKVGEFFEVTGLGMDCTLIRTELFTKIDPPWFKTVEEDKFADGINSADTWTEDLYFLKKVVEDTEYKVYCDASILCTHWDVYASRGYTLPQGSLPLRKLQTQKDKCAIDIGCGETNRASEFPDYELVRVDIRDECKPDYRCDVSCLPFGTESFDLVFSSHVLEHFPRGKWEGVLDEWCRLCKVGGHILLILPNITWATKKLEETQDEPDWDTLNVFYGAQSNDFDYHYNGFTEKRLQKALEDRHFKVVEVSHSGYNMLMRGVKNGN